MSQKRRKILRNATHNIEDRPATKRPPAVRRMLPRLFVSRGPFTRYPCSATHRCREQQAQTRPPEQRQGRTRRIQHCFMPKTRLLARDCSLTTETWNVLWRPKARAKGWLADHDMGALCGCGFDRESNACSGLQRRGGMPLKRANRIHAGSDVMAHPGCPPSGPPQCGQA